MQGNDRLSKRQLPCLQGLWNPQYYSAELSELVDKCAGPMMFYLSALHHIRLSPATGLIPVGFTRLPANLRILACENRGGVSQAPSCEVSLEQRRV